MLKNLRKRASLNLFFVFIVLIFIGQFLSSLNYYQKKEDLLTIDLLNKNALERYKYVEEIRKLKLDNDRSLLITLTPLLAPFVTLLIAFFGALWSFHKEKEAQRDKDTKDKERQFNEKYNNIVINLGADSLSIRASNASALLNFLQPEHKKFWDDILIIVPVNLKKSICVQPAIQESLTRVLEKAIRVKLNAIENDKTERPFLETLNLSRTTLFRLNFEDFNFTGINVDVAFANMRYANLNNSKLPRLRGIGVCLDRARISRCNLQEARLNQSRCRKAQFHDSYLMSATFKEADLRGAEFHKARLQSVHFNGAKLQGANFTQSNLTDAYFTGAKLDDVAINSILKSYKSSWKRAHFDKKIEEELYSLNEYKNHLNLKNNIPKK